MKMKFSTTTFIKKILLVCHVTTLSTASFVSLMSVPVKAQQICDSSNSASYGARPSETRRTVELPSIGIAIAIPENYRTMQLQDGAVQIVHPSTFDMIQCTAGGGRGGHGFYYERINSVEDDLTMDLREQATWLGGYSERSDGSRVPTATEVIPYEKDGLSGYIVASSFGYGASFLGIIPGQDSLLEVSAGCDCQVGVDAIEELLPYITLMD